MKLLAVTIGGSGSQPSYNIPIPKSLQGATGLNLQTLIKGSLNLILTAAILLALFFVLFGGLKWMLSQGDKKQVEEAQKTITYAIIGLVVTLLSFFLINMIGFLFQVPLGG